MTTIRRVDPPRNMKRFYVLVLQTDLLVGCAGMGAYRGAGRGRIDAHVDLADAEAEVQWLEACKRRRGYCQLRTWRLGQRPAPPPAPARPAPIRSNVRRAKGRGSDGVSMPIQAI